MQYLLMCCFDEKQWDTLPVPQREDIMQAYGDWIAHTTRSGHYRAGGKLESSASATTVREKNGKAAITDGPFAETKEQLGGYHVLECRDLDEALALAQGIPTLPAGGTVEVRPLARVLPG